MVIGFEGNNGVKSKEQGSNNRIWDRFRGKGPNSCLSRFQFFCILEV